MVRLNAVDWAALVLTVIGAINWGLVGLFGFNLVHAIFGGVPVLESLIYIIVGLAGLWQIYLMVRLSQHVPAVSAH
ncbi:MAG: DUF378 domain-containing protein [Chloroflexi bacterium]|nr:DUF378 domain-containing protein [Chloroflexota bacterium]